MRDVFDNSVGEATTYTRDSGWHFNSRGNSTVAEVFCQVGSDCLKRENVLDTFEGFKIVLRSINVDHDCRHFVKWQEGKTPKEHEEMRIAELNRIETIRRQQAFEALYETRHQENLGVLKEQLLKSHISLIVSIIALFISTIVAIAQIWIAIQ